MKKIVFITVLLAAFQFANAQEKVSIQLKGLGCPYCSMGFVKTLKKMGKISDMKTNYEEGTFDFQIVSPDFNMAKLKTTVKKAGYVLVYANIDYKSKKDELFGKKE